MSAGRVCLTSIVPAVGLLGFAPALVEVASAASNGRGAGCAPDRPAVAHCAGAVPAFFHRALGLRSRRVTPTGFRTSEINLAVTNTETILFQPAFPETGSPIGATRSTNLGARWSFILPSASDNPPRITPVDESMRQEPRTGRIFWGVGTPQR